MGSEVAVQLVAEIAARLRAAGVASPEVDARLLVEHTHDDDRPAWRRREHLAGLVGARTRRVPLQLLLGGTWFRHLHLACRVGVFIPRPETEIVAGEAIAAARRAAPRPRVADLGTGTGAIAWSVVAEVPGAHVWATDASQRAARLAQENLDRLVRGVAGVAGPAPGAAGAVLTGDLDEPLHPTLQRRLDVLVSNPPYLPAADAPRLPPEVADHDPADALFGGVDGYEQVRRVMARARTWLRPGGTVVVEIDERRPDDARTAATAAGLEQVRMVDDLTGAVRALVAVAPDGAGTRTRP